MFGSPMSAWVKSCPDGLEIAPDSDIGSVHKRKCQDGTLASFRHSGEAIGFLQLPDVLISKRSSRPCPGHVFRWRDKSKLLPELLRSFDASHCDVPTWQMVWVMTQRIRCALEPLFRSTACRL